MKKGEAGKRMGVRTKQEVGFAEGLVETAGDRGWMVLSEVIDWEVIKEMLSGVGTDYEPVGMFRMMMMQTWHNLLDEVICEAMKRDIEYMRFCGFRLDGKNGFVDIVLVSRAFEHGWAV